MNHPVFQESLFDEADHVGEIRKRTSGCAGFQGLKLSDCGPCLGKGCDSQDPVKCSHHLVRALLGSFDECRICGERFYL